MGGVTGVLAMTALQLLFDHLRGTDTPRVVHELSQRGGRHDIARLKVRARRWHQPQKDATVRAAEAIHTLVGSRRMSGRQRHLAGVTVHYAFGALVGAAYGWAVEFEPRIAARSGLPFGVAVWLFAEELALPVAGLTDTPDKYPVRDHLNALVAHLVFGSTTETVRRSIARSARKNETKEQSHNVEPETTAHEGFVSTRTPKRPVQGITSHTAEQESSRQEKVVNNRADARAGVNRNR